MPLIKRLRETEPFSQLPDEAFQQLRETARLQKFPQNTDIFQQHAEPTGYLYVIKEGLVAIKVMSPGGLEMTVDYRKEGDFFGGTPIFTGEPYAGGARTVKPTECYLIPADLLQSLQRQHPQLSRYFTHLVLSRVRSLYAEIVSQNADSSMAQMEAYPFKKRLSDIMSSPVITCLQDDTARDVARRLTGQDLNCLIVVDGQGRPVGSVTCKDLVTRVLAAEDADPLAVTAGDIMHVGIHALPPETYMYEAMATMSRHRLDYLVVVDRDQLVGLVTAGDLMRYRCQKALMMLGSIRDENSLQGLADRHRELIRLAHSLLSETRSTPEVMEILSYVHQAIIQRVLQICLNEMASAGEPLPEIRFCFLIMGSGGRREMLLKPDQDHGFIFEDLPQEEYAAVEPFFIRLGERLAAALATVGYPLCEGGVMAGNPAWRGRLQDWQERIGTWLFDPEPTHVRESSIFFDFYPLYGDSSLAHELREIVSAAIKTHQGFLYHMMTLDLRYKVPLGLLNRFVVEKDGPHQGKLSLKYGGSMYVVDCVRMFALERDIQEVSTLKRLQALVAQNVFASETAEHIRAAFEALVFLRLRHEVQQLENGEEPSHFIDPFRLGKTEQDLLREAFQAVDKLQDATKRHFSRSPF
ncbi:MAG: putative nucleotidyltransferase substrate binding domain-containing protein [Desulfuromonadales bacterium]|nr:putative nucleotidyltransferase substrate binding domain-containing protein [Desulfuromonadales bacterium]